MIMTNENIKLTVLEEQKRVLEQAKAEGNPNNICEVLGRIARMLVDAGEAEAALPYLDEAISLADENGLINLKATNLGNRGVALVRLKRFDKAREYFEQVEEIAEENSLPALKCDALMQKTIMHLEISRGDLAQIDLMDALAIAEGIDDKNRQMKVLALLAHNHFNIASFDEAAEFFGKALTLAEETGNQAAQAGYHHNLGNVYYAGGLPSEAISHLTKAIDLFQNLGDSNGELNALLRLVKSYADDDQPENTYITAQKGLRLARQLQDEKASKSFQNLLIVTSSHLRKFDDTLELIEDSMTEADNAKDNERKLNLFISRGNTYYEMDDFSRAKEAYLQGVEIAVRLQDWNLNARLLGRLSAVEAELGNLEQSIEYGKQALERAEKVGDRRLIGEQYMMLAFGARDKGDFESAKAYAEKASEYFSLIEAKPAIEKLNQFLNELAE